MARAIVLLVAPRPFVFLDEIAIVLVDGITSRDSALLVPVGSETVDVDARCLLREHRCVSLESLVVVNGQFIHGAGVWIRIRRQIYFRARDVKKAQRISGRQRPRLFGVDDIVRNGSDACCCASVRSDCAKRRENSHI